MSNAIGNENCRYNALSPFVRCAVNPDGPCDRCPSFEAVQGKQKLAFQARKSFKRAGLFLGFAHNRIKIFSEVLTGSCAIAFVLMFGNHDPGLSFKLSLLAGVKVYVFVRLFADSANLVANAGRHFFLPIFLFFSCYEGTFVSLLFFSFLAAK